MADIDILFVNEGRYDAEVLEWEAKLKGYRRDVFVRVGDEYYCVAVWEINSLKQQFELQQEHYGYFTPDANLILVQEVSKSHIIPTITKLCESETFFSQLKPIGSDEVTELMRQGSR